MDSRNEIIDRLSSVPTANLLDFLDDKVLHELATRYFNNLAELEAQRLASIETGFSAEPPAVESAKSKPKRPLNAFMAFRCYYLKMFPVTPQKFISGFLTTLWGQDPYRTRWALVAKVYSFIRDEIGKDKISLSDFLGIACPFMRITDPAIYLSTLGWHVQKVEGEDPQLIRHGSSAKPDTQLLESEKFPTTEIDLLLAVLKFGFLPKYGRDLIRKMKTNGKPLMATNPAASRRLQADGTIEKLDFMNTLREDPNKAAKELFGQHYDDSIMREAGYKIHDVASLADIQHLPLHRPLNPKCYPYSPMKPQSDPNMATTFDFSPPEHDCYDFDDPYDVNTMTGYEGYIAEPANGSFNTDSPPYSPHDDFHIIY